MIYVFNSLGSPQLPCIHSGKRQSAYYWNVISPECEMQVWHLPLQLQLLCLWVGLAILHTILLKFQHFLNSRPHELASFESAIAVAAVRSSLAQAARCLEAGSKWEETVSFQTSSSPDVSVNLAIIFLLSTKQLFWPTFFQPLELKPADNFLLVFAADQLLCWEDAPLENRSVVCHSDYLHKF